MPVYQLVEKNENIAKRNFFDFVSFRSGLKGLIVNAYVIMSSHIHLVVRASERSGGMSNILRDMKKHIAKEVINWVKESSTESRREWLLNVFEYHAKYTITDIAAQGITWMGMMA